MDKALRITFEGEGDESTNVRFAEFTEKLESFMNFLRALNQGDRVEYYVTDLSHSSPAKVGIKAVSQGWRPAICKYAHSILGFPFEASKAIF